MADITDVGNALVSICASAIYPNGIGQQPASGVQAKIYQGWPDPATLQADLAAHTAHVSVSPAAQDKVTTRRNPEWQQLIAPAPTLVATVAGTTITLSGTVTVPQAVALLVDGKDCAYGLLITDTLATIAAALALLISAGQPATASGAVITIPGSHRLSARIVAQGTSAKEVALEMRLFTIGVWADCYDRREPLAKLLTPVLASLTRLLMPDGSYATVEYAGSTQVDSEQRNGIYRRDIRLSVEYATIATRIDNAVGIAQPRNSLVFNSIPVPLPPINS